jgi:hypothetical protein
VAYAGDVLNPQGGTVLRFDDRFSDIACSPHETERAHVDLLESGFDEASSGVHVVIGELLLNLSEAQVVGDQLVRVNAHLILARRPTEAGHIHHVRHGLKRLFENPIFQRLQFHDVVLRIGTAKGIKIHLTDRAPIRAHLRLQAGRQSHLRKPLQHL